MDQPLKVADDDTTKKEDHLAIKKLQEGINKSVKNISSFMKKRNEEDKLLKIKQEERSKLQEEVVNMKGQLRYDSVQMSSIKNNFRQIDEKKDLIEGYTTKIKTILPNFSEDSLTIKDKLLQHKNHIEEFLRNLDEKFQRKERERALVEERKRGVKQTFQETVESLNSDSLNVTINLNRLKRDKHGLQENLKQIEVDNEVVTQNIESVRNQKELLKIQLEDKQQLECELLHEVNQQKVVFGRTQQEVMENFTNLSAKIQEAESERKTLEMKKAEKKNLTINILKELEVKEMENSNLKLKNDELAITLNQAENKIEEDNKNMEVEFSSKLEEAEKSKNGNKELETMLDEFEKKLVLGKQAKREIDLKIENIGKRVEKLKVECEQLRKLVQDDTEKIERLTEELSITQGEIVSLNEELSKQKESENMEGEAEIKEIELEIETLQKKNEEDIAEIIKSNNRLVTEFEEQTKNEMACFEKESREIESKIRAFREILNDENLVIKVLEEGLVEKDEELEGLTLAKSLVKPVKKTSMIPPKSVRKTVASYSQVPQPCTSRATGSKNVASYSQTFEGSTTRSGLKRIPSYPQSLNTGATRSSGLTEVNINCFSMSPISKRKKFDEMSDSSTEGVSYNFKTFSALRQEQINQKKTPNKKK